MSPPKPAEPAAAPDGAARFAADGALLVVANGLAGLLFLGVHVVLGRRLTGVDYAMVVSLLGLLNVLSVGASAIQLTAARHVAASTDPRVDPTALARWGLSRLMLVGVPALAGWCLLAVPLRGWLGEPPWGALALLGPVAALRLAIPLAHGVLQGLRRFAWIAGAAVGGAVARLIAAWALTETSPGVTSALLAFVASAIVMLGVCLWPIRRRLRHPGRTPQPREATSLDPARQRAIRRDLLRIGGGQLVLFTLANADLILAPRLLTGEALADYGKAALLARTAIFLPLPVVGAMFPRAVRSDRRGVVAAPLLFVGAAAAAIALGIGLAADELLAAVYGQQSAQAAAWFRLYALAVVPLALLEVVLPWLWARDRAGLALSLALPVACYGALLLNLTGRPGAMIASLAAAATVGLLWTAIGARR
ncbi:MAG: polysaccharide biosynthesis C-terminal domain-containing protein [Acidobacteriota bacterium]